MYLSKFKYSIKDEMSLTTPGSSMSVLVASLGRPTPKKPVFGDFHGVSFPVSLRLNITNHAILEAMARRSGQSKNSICNEILAVGFAYVVDHLDDDSQVDIEDLTSQVISEIIPPEALKEAFADLEPVKPKSKTSSKK